MTVPQDVVMCFGMGLAARAAAPAVVCKTRELRKTWTAGFVAGWVPVSCGLLLIWPEWSWWEAEFIVRAPRWGLPIALGLQYIAFVAGLAVAGRVESRLLRGIAWASVVGWLIASGLGWSRFSAVSRPSSGLPPEPLWLAWELIGFLTLSSVWMLWVGWTTVRRVLQDGELSGGDGGAKGESK